MKNAAELVKYFKEHQEARAALAHAVAEAENAFIAAAARQGLHDVADAVQQLPLADTKTFRQALALMLVTRDNEAMQQALAKLLGDVKSLPERERARGAALYLAELRAALWAEPHFHDVADALLQLDQSRRLQQVQDAIAAIGWRLPHIHERCNRCRPMVTGYRLSQRIPGWTTPGRSGPR